MARGVLAVVLAVAVSTCSAARILGVFPLPSPSHKQLYSPLMEALASRGHHVTIISPFEEKTGSNVTLIKVVFERENMLGNFPALLNNDNMFAKMFYVCTFVTAMTEKVLSSPEVARFIQTTDQQFDLVIAVSAFSEALLGFGRLFDAPVITVCSTLMIRSAEEMLGNEVNPSYVPHILLALSDSMTFYGRTYNMLISWWEKLLHRFYVSPAANTVMRKHFRGVELPPSTELYADVALNFINIVPGIHYPRPLTTNMVAVGGLHVLPPRPLPQDMKKFLDEATEGAVLFSLGSNVRSADLSNEKWYIISKVFSKLKQRVLWKFETDDLKELPSNVKIWKWLPQNDVLAHPNLKAFVTHGGQLSGLEALYHGVPVVVMPFFADQFLNAKFAQRRGFGIALQLSDISEDSFHHALSQILYNSSYGDKAALLSRIFRDQPQSALERAVFWTEYVARHKGAPHMRPASADLAWFQHSLLDVAAVLLLVPAALVFCFVLLCTRLFCSSKRTIVADEKKAKKKKV